MPEIHALKTDQPLALPGAPQPSVDDVTRRLYEAAQPSIVRVETTKEGGVGTGTGFAVTRPGLIATDYHCVAGAKEIKVRLSNGDFHRARIKDIDDINDLAILELEGTPPASLKPLPLSDSSKVALILVSLLWGIRKDCRLYTFRRGITSPTCDSATRFLKACSEYRHRPTWRRIHLRRRIKLMRNR